MCKVCKKKRTNDYTFNICGICMAKVKPKLKSELLKITQKQFSRYPDEMPIIKSFLESELKC